MGIEIGGREASQEAAMRIGRDLPSKQCASPLFGKPGWASAGKCCRSSLGGLQSSPGGLEPSSGMPSMQESEK